jgi:hypothetical protein
MADLQHYALFDESLDILRELMGHGLAVIPEEPVLAEPALARYERYSEEVAEKLRKYPCLLLEGPFTKHPLQFHRRSSGSAIGTYFAQQSVGPRIRWCLPGMDMSDRTVTPGSVSHQSSYLDLRTRQWEPASQELKAAFKDVVAIFKRHMVRMPCNTGERIWVGKAAKQAVEQGTARIER